MKKNQRKKLLGLFLILGALFMLSGCSVPTEIDPETGERVTKLISADTTFMEMFNSEDWFQALFVWPLAKIMDIIAPFVGVAGAIAAVTLGVNILTMLMTLKSTMAQQKMTALQPEIARIQKKYEGKKDEASRLKGAQEQQALYKKHDINPLSSILGAFVQFPVIFAIYHSVQRSAVVQSGSFLGLSLAQSPLDGMMNGQYLYIVLFIVMLVAQIGSMKLPNIIVNYKGKKEADKHFRKYEKTAQPGGNMMIYMMGGIMIMAISWPAAMTIYWTISSSVMIFKTLLINFVFIKDKKD